MKSLIVLLVVCAMASAADRYGGGVRVVENARPNNGNGQIIEDSAFYRPTYPAGGPQKPDISPAWVQHGNGGNNDYRAAIGKNFNDPRLRGGK